MIQKTIYKTIDKKSLSRAYDRLLSLEKIAKEMHVSSKVIRKAMKFHGLSYSRPHVTFDKDLVVRSYKKTGSLRAVAKKLNIDYSQLRYFFCREGLFYKKHNRYTYNQNFFVQNNEESYYWAGFAIADGNNNVIQKLRFELALKDESHLQKFASSISPDKLLEYRINNGGHACVGFSVHSRKIIRDIEKFFNIVPAKSLIYTLPDYLIADPLVKHLIRGIVDGDGCFYVSALKQEEILKTTLNSEIHLLKLKICGTQDLLNKIHLIFYNNGLVDSTYRGIGVEDNLNSIVYSGYCLNKIIKYLYGDATIYLDRKYEIAKLADSLVSEPLKIRHTKWWMKENLTKEALEKDYSEIKNMRELGRKWGVSSPTIKKYLKQFGII